MNGIIMNNVVALAASIRRFLAVAILVIPATIATANTTVLPFQEIESVDPLRNAVFSVAGGSIDQPLASFGATDLQPATMRKITLSGNAADPYDPAGGRSAFFLLASHGFSGILYLRPEALIAELLAGTSPGVALLIGADSNGDGKPQTDEVICEAEFASEVARCIVAIDGSVPGPYWVMAVAPGGTGATYTAVLSAGLPEIAISEISSYGNGSGGQIGLARPPSVDAGQAFALGMTWTIAPMPLQRYYGAVLMGQTDVLGSFCCSGSVDALIPFALEDSSAYPVMIDPASGPLLLTSYHTQGPVLPLPVGQSAKRLFFDLPTSASTYESIVVDGRIVSGPGSTPTPNLELALVHSDFPASSQSAVVAAAPADAAPVVRWNVTTNDQDVTAVLPHPQAGRWYIVATNKGTDPVAFVTNIADSSKPPNTTSGFGRGANPLLVPGNYFNPQRSGHGISISQAAGQQLMFWYTYLQDGTPVWYLAQAAAPAADSGWWASPLYQVSWDGNVGTPTQVGYVELVPTATNRLMFTWHLGDASGSETFELLASGKTCASANGVATNFSGNWFAPSQAGYGVDVLGLPDQQFDVFYFYDASGIARWGIGAAPFATNSTLDMLQSSGFCPLCDYTPVTTQALGPMTINFTADASSGTFVTNFTFKAPLEGTFNIDKPIIRLTGSNTCQ